MRRLFSEKRVFGSAAGPLRGNELAETVWIPTNDSKYTKVFNSSSRLPFSFDTWASTSKSRLAGIIPVLAATPGPELEKQLELLSMVIRPEHTLVILNLFHIDDGQDGDQWFERQHQQYSAITDRRLIIHSNLRAQDREVYFDFLWARQKLYFTSDLWPRDLHWTKYSTLRQYRLNPIFKGPIQQIFLSPTRVYNIEHPRMQFRSRLLEELENLSARTSPIPSEEVTQQILDDINGNSSIWYPCANSAYESTLVSVYVETITQGLGHQSITEKTWDPLIKGHWILPFGYSGIIKDILSYGYLLPPFIDYSYDAIEDCEDRWRAFVKEIHRLNDLGQDKLLELTLVNQQLLEHNRQIFWSKPMPSLRASLLEKIHSMDSARANK